jgi:hypothetical protein
MQNSQTEGQWCSDTSPFSIPWIGPRGDLQWYGFAGVNAANDLPDDDHVVVRTLGKVGKRNFCGPVYKTFFKGKSDDALDKMS